MKRELRKAFMSGVDGANTNLFATVRVGMQKFGLINGINVKKTITIGELYKLFCDVEDKQDKDIDKYLASEQ